MRKTVLTVSAMALLCGLLAFAQPTQDAATEILAMERRAMDGWLKGNPDPVLAVMDAEITYFHIMTE
jgi:hypothetical protein